MLSSTFSFGALLRRPEAGAALGLFAVLIFFAIFGGVTFLKPSGMASWLNVAAKAPMAISGTATKATTLRLMRGMSTSCNEELGMKVSLSND